LLTPAATAADAGGAPAACQQQQQQQHVGLDLQALHPPDHSHVGSSSAHTLAALQAAAAGVVMVRVGRSWGSGVLITHSGLVLTVAHLFRNTAAAAASAAAAAAAGRGARVASSGGGSCSSRPALPHEQQAPDAAPTDASVMLWVSAAASRVGSSNSASRQLWVPARLVGCFSGYLDLAVLQMELGATHHHQQQQQQQQQQQCGGHGHRLHPLSLAGSAQGDCLAAGDEVFVIGHGLFGPRPGWPPAVTAGCVARVLCVTPDGDGHASGGASASGSASASRRQPKPSMVISTAAVHAGASGGALVSRGGALLGLVTSNARHGSGATLPHLNFCISASELRPVVEWALAQQQQQQQQQQERGGAHDAQDGWRRLAQLDVRDAAGFRLWALQPFA
jgi:S1-C subfamily serine protease